MNIRPLTAAEAETLANDELRHYCVEQRDNQLHILRFVSGAYTVEELESILTHMRQLQTCINELYMFKDKHGTLFTMGDRVAFEMEGHIYTAVVAGRGYTRGNRVAVQLDIPTGPSSFFQGPEEIFTKVS